MPALCVMSSRLLAGLSCRSVFFNITDDGFQFQSDLLSLLVRTTVIKPVPCTNKPCPYGFPSLFPKFADQVKIISNVTHLEVVMPVMPVLDPSSEERLIFDWHALHHRRLRHHRNELCPHDSAAHERNLDLVERAHILQPRSVRRADHVSNLDQ